jgi:small GTP-binding protein
MAKANWTLLTPASQGAIAIIQLAGDVDAALTSLTDRSTWDLGRMHLTQIPEIDEVVAVKLSENLAHIMPHGGMQILRNFAQRCADLGIQQEDAPQFPEAQDEVEAAMLQTLAIAESPLATELLLAQPPKLRGASPSQEDLARSTRLNHLITPPKVVLLGMPNTGKSTLMNALTRQDTSIVHDLPGATRDAVGARINCAGLVVDLYDLPGYRESDDEIEQKAIDIATTIAKQAALTILIADNEHDWIESTSFPIISVGTKSDLAVRDDADLCVCALNGNGMESLSVMIRDSIVPPEDIDHDGPWFFAGYSPIAE